MAVAGSSRVICASSELEEGGRGVRFDYPQPGGSVPGFAVRYEGVVRAYENACAHVPVQLDWEPGVFFDSAGLYLMCATHGATYEPHTGRCIAGPCKGRSLRPLPVTELDGLIVIPQDCSDHG